jgi:hypothetical protein
MQESVFGDMQFVGGLVYSGTTGDQPLGVTNGYFTLESFNMTTSSPTWIARFQAGQGGNSLLRWGTDGLAFTSGGITAPTIELISGSIVVR